MAWAPMRATRRCRQGTGDVHATKRSSRACLPRLTAPWRRRRDLRDWIALLEREGELHRITAEVDPHLEVTEIVDRLVKSGGGPALLFENPKGSEHPLLINQFGTERRMAMAFGAPSLDAVAEKLADVLEMQPPQGLREKVQGLKKLKSIADSRPKVVSKGACQEIVLTGDEVDITRLPIQTLLARRPGALHHASGGYHEGPETGTRNVGMYRMQVIDGRSTYMHWQMHKDGRADLLAAEDGKIPVAVALGLDPVTAYSASAPLPHHIDELMVAGFLRGDEVELVKCKTIDLEVPANAEIVLEGTVSKDDVGIEGPFGDHTGYYSHAEEFPIFRISRDDDAARRDLSVDRRRQAAGRGRVARQGDRAHLPAGRPHDAA